MTSKPDLKKKEKAEKTKKESRTKKRKLESKKEGLKKRAEILKKFTEALLKKHGNLIRSVVLMGSTATQEFKPESDIDVFIIIDDTKNKITPRMIEDLEEDVDKIAESISKQLSIQRPYLLTEFWRLVRMGHPIILNFIRDGIPIFDKDIFLPFKKLLQMGEIKPSKEAVEEFMDKVPKRIDRVENAKLYMVVEDCFYALVESAQAVLMFMEKHPPKPKEIANVIRETLVKNKFLDEKYAQWIEEIVDLRKKVEHKEIKELSGQEVDKWIERAKEFNGVAKELIAKIEIFKRKDIVERSYKVMTETTLTLLKALNKLPAKEDEIETAFDNYLVKPGLISKKYLDVFIELKKFKNIVESGKILDLKKEEILLHREYVRKFIREAGKVLKKYVKEKEGIKIVE